MSDTLDIEVDDDLLSGFLDEASDFLSEIDALLVELEDDPTNAEIINGIFRPIHSIKGNAPFFGFTKLRTLAHEMETVLAQLRDGSLHLTKTLVSVLLEGTDELKEMIERAKEKEPEVIDQDRFDDLVNKVITEQGGGLIDHSELWMSLMEQTERLAGDLQAVDPGLLSGFSKIQELLQILCPEDFSKIEELGLPTPIVSVKAAMKACSSDPSSDVAAQNLLESIYALKGSWEDQDAEAIVDKLIEDVPPYLSTIGFDELLAELISEPLDKLGEFAFNGVITKSPPLSEPDSQSQEAKPKGQVAEKSESKGTRAEATKSMRVSEEHIDEFLSYVGELFIFGEMLAYIERRIVSNEACKDVAFEFSRLTESFRLQSQNLQKSLMSIRKVPVKGLLQKAPRLVRDIANTNGKEINVNISGQEVEVDKSLVELIDSPLTHMVRNAADHGVEDPETRESQGKDRVGTIEVSVTEDEKFIVLKVEDDGAGLNYDAIQSKAESLGLTPPGKALTESQVVDFLFQAGVSTAKEVTDVSGRGVGMDVVKRTIEMAGGNISVKSKAGAGTLFRVALPKSVTTHIVESLVFLVNGRWYAVPIDRVAEVFLREQGTVFSAAGTDRFINRHDEILPIVPACNILSMDDEDLEDYSGTCVISVRANGRKMALFVDEVISVQQLVMKSLQNIEVKDVYAGGALIGDGQIALLLELDKFCKGYDENCVAERSHVADSIGSEGPKDDDYLGEGERRFETLLLAELSQESRVGIPLSQVNRLEKVRFSEIELAGGKPVVQYRDSIMPLLSLTSDDVKSLRERDGTCSIVVALRGEQHYGIIVNKILDIVEEELLVETVGDDNLQVSGTAVVQDKITDILNIDGVLSCNGF